MAMALPFVCCMSQNVVQGIASIGKGIKGRCSTSETAEDNPGPAEKLLNVRPLSMFMGTE